MIQLITWDVYNSHTHSIQLSKVHAMEKGITLCGKSPPGQFNPYRRVRTWINRPCKVCLVATTKRSIKFKNEVEKVATKVNFAAVATSMAKPAGDYECTFAKFTFNPASASSGNPTVSLEWTVNETNNQRIFKTYSLQPQALWSLKRDLIHMGADIEEMNSEDADLEDILNSLVGAQNTIVMGEPQEGKRKDGTDGVFDNFKEVRDPAKVGN